MVPSPCCACAQAAPGTGLPLPVLTARGELRAGEDARPPRSGESWVCPPGEVLFGSQCWVGPICGQQRGEDGIGPWLGTVTRPGSRLPPSGRLTRPPLPSDPWLWSWASQGSSQQGGVSVPSRPLPTGDLPSLPGPMSWGRTVTRSGSSHSETAYI